MPRQPAKAHLLDVDMEDGTSPSSVGAESSRKAPRGTKRGRPSRVISSDEEGYGGPSIEATPPKRARPSASRAMSSEPDDDYNNNDQSADVDVDVEMADDVPRAPPMAGHSARAKRPSMKAAASMGASAHAPPVKATARTFSPPNFFSDEDDTARSKPSPASPKPAAKRAAAPPKSRKPPAKRAKRQASDSESEFDDPDVVIDDDLSGLENDDDEERPARASTSAASKLKGRGIIITNAKGKAAAQKKKAAKESEAIAISARNEGASSSKKPPAKRSSSEDKDSAAAASEQSQPPPAKKAKLPAVPRKSGAPSGLRTTGLPAAAASTTPTSRPPLTKQASIAKKGGEIDLNNADEYNKLFGISSASGSSTPKVNKPAATSTVTSNFRNAEQKAKEIAAKREQAKADRARDWDPSNCFDIMTSGDKIRAYESRLWQENRYLYISQVASAWSLFPSPPAGQPPHRLPPPPLPAGRAPESPRASMHES